MIKESVSWHLYVQRDVDPSFVKRLDAPQKSEWLSETGGRRLFI